MLPPKGGMSGRSRGIQFHLQHVGAARSYSGRQFQRERRVAAAIFLKGVIVEITFAAVMAPSKSTNTRFPRPFLGRAELAPVEGDDS